MNLRELRVAVLPCSVKAIMTGNTQKMCCAPAGIHDGVGKPELRLQHPHTHHAFLPFEHNCMIWKFK